MRLASVFAAIIGLVLIGALVGYFGVEAVTRSLIAVGWIGFAVICLIHLALIAAMGIAWASELEHGETFTTLELKINFMKPVWRGHLLAEGKVVKRGRTVGLVECDVFDEKGSLVARASSTCMTLRAEMAKGR